MKKIIVPVDGSEHSMRAVEKAKDIAKAMNSNIVLVNVVEPLPVKHAEMTQPEAREEMQQARERSKLILDEAKALLEKQGCGVETVVLEGVPYQEIIEFIENREVEMVGMGSHGMMGIKRFLIGSVTNKVIHHVAAPVLVVK